MNQTQTLMALCQQLGWLVNLQKSELVPQQEFNFVGSFRPLQGSSEADSGEVANPNSENKDANEQRTLFGPRVHVSHRFVDSHRETGGFGSPSHETDSVALEESLARARGPREGDSSSQISIPSSAVVAGRKQCAQRPTSSSSATCSAVVYRRLKRRLGRALRRPHGKRSLVGLRKPVAHKLSRAKSGPSGPQEVRATVLGPDHFDSHGQHNGCLIHQQGGGYEIRLTLCPPLETAFLVQSQTDSSKGQAHSGKAECDSRQIVQEHSGYSEWSLLQEVFDHLCARWHSPRVDLFATRYNHKLPKFVSPVPDPQAWRVDALSLNWENMDAYAFPPVSLLGKVVSKILDQGVHRLVLIAPGWPNMPWFWDLVSMSVQIPLSLPNVENLLTQPFNQCPHRDLLGLNLHAWLLEPLAYRHKDSLMKWQRELRLLKDNQPEPSMNRSDPYLSNGASHTRWTSGHLL